jgi:Tol biopolymer transport system component
MEFIRGRTLEAELREEGPFHADEIVQLGIQLCSALTAVHKAGLVHRDVKAQNIMRDATARVVLGDFGTGHELEHEPAAIEIAGTPACLAPEIFEGHGATPQSDIYSLGTLLFHLATGSYPVTGKTLPELREAHRAGRRTSLQTLRPDLPENLVRTIERALQPHPADRFNTAAAMESSLTDRPRSSRRMVAAGVIVAITLLAITLFNFSGYGGRTPLTEEKAVTTDAHVVPAFAPPTLPTDVLLTTKADLKPAAPLPIPEVVTFQKVHPDLQLRANLRNLSDDGIHATCTPWGQKVVGICNIKTGEIKEVRVTNAAAEQFGPSMLSPDGSQVVYEFNDATGRSARLINSDGTNDRELYRGPGGPLFVMSKWIRQGKAVLFAVSDRASVGMRWVSVPAIQGDVEEILQTDIADPAMSLSPDGQFFVFARPDPGNGKFDLKIVSLRSGEESWLLQHPADDSKPVWTPDGKAVVFISDRLGTSGVYVLPVKDGRAVGDGVLVCDLGRSSVESSGMAGNGTLMLRLNTHWVDAFQASIDLDKGTLGSPSKIEIRSIEDTASPDWNPDGRSFAYLMAPIGRPTKARILIRRKDGRLEREMPLEEKLGRNAWLRWSPDARYFAIRYAVDNPSTVLQLVDAETGVSSKLFQGPAGSFSWSHTGDAIYFSDGRRIQRYEIATGAATTLLEAPIGRAFGVSPRDGSIALAAPVGGCSIAVLGPGARLLSMSAIRRIADGECTGMTWSRDGKKLIVASIPGPEPPVHLSIVDPAGGDPVRLTVPTEAIFSLSLDPEDRQLLFSAGNPKPEFWMLSGITSQVPEKASPGSSQ